MFLPQSYLLSGLNGSVAVPLPEPTAPRSSSWATPESNGAQVITFGVVASLVAFVSIFLHFRQLRAAANRHSVSSHELRSVNNER